MQHAVAHLAMATITSTHTAFGFDCALDWRPTSFVEAVSSSYVCSACKLVPRILTVLPCRHKLCPQCCIHAGRRINHCPLDKKAFDEKDVMFSILGTESVLSRRVRCWNAEHGCDVEDEASVMLEHFRRDCRFHFASCPNCGRTLPHRDVSSHLESCRYPEEPYSPEEYTREEHSAGKSLAEYLFSAFEEVTRRSLDGNTSVIRWHPSIGQRLSSERTNETTRPTTTVVNTVEDAVASTRAPYDLVVFASPDEIDSASAERELSSSALSTGEPSQSAGVLLHKSASAASDEQDNLCAAPANPFMSRTKQATVAVSGSTAIDDALAGAENIEDETESQSKLGPGASLEALMDVPECCEFTIENWSSFTEDKPLATAVYGQCECGTRVLSYGYLIVPKMIFSKVNFLSFSVYAFRGSEGCLSEHPFDTIFRVRFVHPSDSEKDLRLNADVIWIAPTVKKVMGRRVRFVWYSKEFVSIFMINESGLVTNDQVRMRFKLTPW